ncbi:MAG TPA: response regulator [Polyangia bacterium]|nr:response regulator [Polyangia bacterium]
MNETVLIVDDSLTVRMDLSEAFAASGFHTRPCATIAEARRALADETVAVAILDVILPDGDGVELLEEIRASKASSDVAVLMLSTEIEVKDRLRGLKTGADEYVGKPYDTEYLLARVRDLLRARAPSDTPTTKILLIDDSVTLRTELRSVLEQAGYFVITATTGEEGLREAAGQRPDAIVVDGVLPGIDGATVIRRLRLDAALRGIPCLLLTGSEDKGAELRALDAGADAFLRKDADRSVILAKLAAVLRRTTADSRAGQTTSLLGPKRVLAVDDSATYLQELAGALRGEGFDVVLGRSGEEALELLGVQGVDCILLDLVMPGLGGQETCRRIKAAPILRDIPLVMLTAMEDRQAMVDGLGAGADDFIPKSSDFEVLKARVRAQLRRKQFEDETRRIREELLSKELEANEARAARELADARALLLEELERKNKELEAFSYSVSHDLRAPLRGIDGFSQALLEDHASALDDKGRDYLRRVRAGAQRMGALIDDMLQLFRVSRTEMRSQRVDLAQLARTVVGELERQDPARQVEVRIQDDLIATGDANLIRIVLDNLVGNAWKFASKVAHAKIEIGAVDRQGVRTFFVRDNGAGFDMAYAEKLFQPFQRLHSTSDFPGTGIGLATVHKVIDRSGGRVWAESAVGAGATFFFHLPPPKPNKGSP